MENKLQQIVTYLLGVPGVNIDAKTKQGKTPLHIAAENGYVDIARILINNGADINAQDKDGDTPYGLATDEFAQVFDAYRNLATHLNNLGNALAYLNDMVRAAQ